MIDDILYMYEAVQAVPAQREEMEIVDIILNFANRVSSECNAFFVPQSCQDKRCLVCSKQIDSDIKDIIMNKINSMSWDISFKDIIVHPISCRRVIAFIRVSNIKWYGTFGLVIPKGQYECNRGEYETNLILISQLAATFFDKIESEFVSNQMAVADEQNRIADDIHDSVVQRLFASSCFGYDIINKWDEIPDDDKKEQIKLITQTIQSSLKDLRSTIYNLSSKKQQTEFFKENVLKYLQDMQRLSNVNISADIKGETCNLSLSAKKALYRIITECTANAIKHAKCNNIWISVNISQTQTFVSIRDDGIGLDLEKAENEKNGLGLYNIKSLVRIFNGSINIIGEKSTGTTIDIIFKNSYIFKNK